MVRINDSLEEIQVPFKIFMGEHASRVDVNAVKKLAEMAKSKNKRIEIVPGAYHQLYQDMTDVTKSI
jgi:alpha-beta hydrolase superfamily lysophospholipase